VEKIVLMIPIGQSMPNYGTKAAANYEHAKQNPCKKCQELKSKDASMVFVGM
jgi:hypothetical protein